MRTAHRGIVLAGQPYIDVAQPIPDRLLDE